MSRHDVDVRRVAIAGVAIAAGVVAAVLAVALLLRHWGMPLNVDRDRSPPATAGPALSGAPQFDLQRYRAEKQRLLESSEWIAPARGIVRIPLATAMALMAERAASAPASGARP